MKYETKQKLETVAFFGIIFLSVVAMVALMSYGNEWSMALAKHLLGIQSGN